MEMKPYRAFGLIFMVNTHYVGERYKTIVNNPRCSIFCSKGRQTSVNDLTGKVMGDYGQGIFLSPEILENTYKGNYTLECVEETISYCYDPELNMGHDQKFDVFNVEGGAETILSKGSRLLLCEGSISIDGTVFVAPARIHVESGDRLVTVNEHALGLFLL